MSFAFSCHVLHLLFAVLLRGAFPVASGWIAGESLTGVLLVMWENGPDLLHRLLGG